MSFRKTDAFFLQLSFEILFGTLLDMKTVLFEPSQYPDHQLLF